MFLPEYNLKKMNYGKDKAAALEFNNNVKKLIGELAKTNKAADR